MMLELNMNQLTMLINLVIVIINIILVLTRIPDLRVAANVPTVRKQVMFSMIVLKERKSVINVIRLVTMLENVLIDHRRRILIIVVIIMIIVV